jgi:hypothetical protein
MASPKKRSIAEPYSLWTQKQYTIVGLNPWLRRRCQAGTQKSAKPSVEFTNPGCHDNFLNVPEDSFIPRPAHLP